MVESAIHATVVAIGRWGIAITGPSGSGKSDLALRLIDRGAKLVGDDYVVIVDDAHLPIAGAASNLSGKIEVRGIGIIPMDYLGQATLRLCVVLGEDGERMPDPSAVCSVSGFAIPSLKLNAFNASAPIKVELALQTLVDAGQWPVPDSTVDQTR
jgi:HPr kinase/phosphorylase